MVILVALIVVGYLIFSLTRFQQTSKDEVCNSFVVNVEDSSDVAFIAKEEITKLVKQEKLYPVGMKMGEINTLKIRDAILSNKLIRSAEVYTTQSGDVVVNVTQRLPVFRVITAAGENYYIDNNRQKMPTSAHFTVDVPLATGVIKDSFAQEELFDFVRYLNKNPDWDAFVEQIVVTPNQKVEIVPRVGDFRIVLGSLDDYEKKFEKLTVFMKKGLQKVGWDRYSVINLSYGDQVVCTRRDSTATLVK